MTFGYTIWIGDMLVPIAPETLENHFRSSTKTTTTIEGGELVLRNTKGLIEYQFRIIIPQSSGLLKTAYVESLRSTIATVPKVGGFLEKMTHSASYYIDRLEYYKNTSEPFTFTMSASVSQGRMLHDICTECVLDSLVIHYGEQKNNMIQIDISLLEYHQLQILTYDEKDASIIKGHRNKTTWYDMDNVDDFFNCGVNLLEREYNNAKNYAKNWVSDKIKQEKGKLMGKATSFLKSPIVNGIKKLAWTGLKIGVTAYCPILGMLL